MNVRINRRKIRTPVACRHKSSGVANGANHFRHPEADYTAARGSRPRSSKKFRIFEKVILGCYKHRSCMTAAEEPSCFVLRIFRAKSRAQRGGSQRTACFKLQIVVDADRVQYVC